MIYVLSTIASWGLMVGYSIDRNMRYDSCRIHEPLRAAPAVEAGITDHVWTMEEIVDLAFWSLG